MKKISLKNLSAFEGQQLSREQLKLVIGGFEQSVSFVDDGDSLGGNPCAVTTSDPICGGNCQRSGGAADKCKPKDTSTCTCGGV